MKIKLKINARAVAKNIIVTKEKKDKKNFKKRKKEILKKINLTKKIENSMHEVLYNIIGILKQNMKI